MRKVFPFKFYTYWCLLSVLGVCFIAWASIFAVITFALA